MGEVGGKAHNVVGGCDDVFLVGGLADVAVVGADDEDLKSVRRVW